MSEEEAEKEVETKLDSLREQVLKDLKFDIEKAGEQAFSLISLREKYVHMLSRADGVVKSIERSQKMLHRKLYEHYLKHYSVKVDRRDLKIFIEGDAEWIKLQKNYDEAKTITKYLDGVVSSIDQHGYSLGHAIKFLIWKSGG